MSEPTAPLDQAEAHPAPAAPLARPAPPADASAANDREEWLDLMDQIADEDGYFEHLRPRHWAFFVDAGPTLLVTFETLDDIRARPTQLPQGFDLAKERGWSHLCLISDGATWYRDSRVYGYFDRLVDDAFFEDFDQVIFMGAGVQGYAAAAFSVAAPGAAVLLISPRATQSPDIANWDSRDRKARKLDFKSRYGFAPDMIEGAGRVYVIYDPTVAEDAMHAALFSGKHVTHLKTPYLGGRVDWAFAHILVWGQLVDAATDGSLSRQSFAKIWRARRTFGPYLRRLLALAGEGGHIKREKWICRSVTSQISAPTFRKRLNEILALEAEAAATAALAELPDEILPEDENR